VSDRQCRLSPASWRALIGFLSARLDEDEANARAAQSLWPDTHFTISPGSLVLVEFHRRHVPARVLREVEAKRRMLEDLDLTYPDVEQLLAAVYSDHPDYRPEWAPGV
jgi:hypothetical protein